MKKVILLLTLTMALPYCGNAYSWDFNPRKTASTSGAKKMSVKIPLNKNGASVEQVNIAKRVMRDNKPGAMKHLYTISAFSGDVILYSPVVGKVTSSGKRLDPVTVSAGNSGITSLKGMPINIAGNTYYTEEALQADSTYGSSIPYIYWFSATDSYHQHYVTGGQIIHVSDVPLSFPKVILNLDTGK